MAEKNSLWKNIRKKAEQNRRTGATPKKPTAEMLRQERKIKAKKYPDGGEMPLGLPLKEQNPYLVPEYNQPIANGYILPDPNRPRILPDINASEYKITYGTDKGDIQVPSIVAGQYIGDKAWDRYKLTGEEFKPMLDPSSYSKFYDMVEPLGLMKDTREFAEGGKYLTVNGEYHRVYKNADGDIIVNHPKEDKGKWDTINLTNKSDANTISQGVAAVKKWHRENPSYAQGGYYAKGGFTGPGDDDKVFKVYKRNSPEYKDYIIRKRLSDFSKLPYARKEELLRNENFISIFSDPDTLFNVTDDKWNDIISNKLDEFGYESGDWDSEKEKWIYKIKDYNNPDIGQPTKGTYGSSIEYNYSPNILPNTEGTIPIYTNYYYNDPTYSTNISKLLNKYKPSKYHNQTIWGDTITNNTYSYNKDLPTAPWGKPSTKEIEDETNLVELQKYYPELTKEELQSNVTSKREHPRYIQNILDSDNGDWKSIYHFDFNDNEIDKLHDIEWNAKKGRYYPESIVNTINKFRYPIPYWDEPSEKISLEPENSDIKLNPTKVLLREMGNLKRNTIDGVEKRMPEVYMDDGQGWRPISYNEYMTYKDLYPGAETEKGWIKPQTNKKSQGGYMYAEGGDGNDNKDGVPLYHKLYYDRKNDKMLKYVGSKDNKYYMMPDDEMIQSRLPEFEFIEDTGKYNPNIVGPSAPRYIPSETKFIPNPNYRPLASGSLEPTLGPIEAALFAPVAGAMATKAVPAVASALELPAVVGGRTLPWLTGNNALAAYFGSKIPSNIQEGDYVSAGLNALPFIKPIASEVGSVTSNLGKVNRQLKQIEKEGLKQGLSSHEISKKQLESVGITSNQRKAYVPVLSDLLEKYVVPYGYSGYGSDSKLTQTIKNILGKDKTLSKYKSEGVLSETRNPAREDAWSLYLGKPQKYNTFRMAETAPINHQSYPIGSLKNMDIYSVNYEDELIPKIGKSTNSHIIDNKIEPLLNPITYDREHNVMGGYNRRLSSSGLEYNDIWDLEPMVKLPFTNKTFTVPVHKVIGKPFMSHGIIPYTWAEHQNNLINSLESTLNNRLATQQEIGVNLSHQITKYLDKLNKVKSATPIYKNGGYTNPYMYYAGGPMQSINNKFSKNNIMNYKRGGGIGGFFKDYGKIMLNAYASPWEALAGKDFYDPEYNTKFGEIADVVNETTTKVGLPIAGSMLLGPQGYQAVKKGSENLSNEFIDTPQQQQQMPPQYPNQNVNQELSFASYGGNINNNSLNLQNNSMRDKYKNYRQRMSKGGQAFSKYGINLIPESSGFHHENAYGGVPIGPNAMAEGGEFILDDNYVVSDQVDGQNTQTDEFGRTMAEKLNKNLSKYTMRSLSNKPSIKEQLRRPMDPLADETINQIKQQAMMETEMARAESQAKEEQNMAMREAALQYAAAGGKLNKDITKIVEEEYYAAYGGHINPKKYRGLNMPYSGGGKLPKEVLRARVEAHMSPDEADSYVEQYAKGGGIHIKKSKRGTFTAAAKKHGKSVQEFARQVLANKGNYSSAMVKKANFARNAAKWKHAKGGYVGPNVSNVQQPYDIYAQNRGGMGIEYAMGGRMYANGGPPDGDPNSLEYITAASDYMYSPEFLNYWTNKQDERKTLYDSKFGRFKPSSSVYPNSHVIPRPEEERLKRFLPDEGISDYDRTLGNLLESHRIITLEEDPSGNLCYTDKDGKKVCGPYGEVMAMVSNRGLQPKIVQRTYQDATGDMAPYNYNNIAGTNPTVSNAERIYGSTAQAPSNYSDRMNDVRRAYESNFGKPANTSQPTIPTTPTNNLGELLLPPAPPLGPYNPDYNNQPITEQEARNQGWTPGGLTSPQTYPDLLPLQGPYDPYGEYGFYGKDADGNDVSINPNMVNQYEQGWRPEGRSTLDTSKLYQDKTKQQGLTGLDYASMAAQAAGPLSQLYYGLKGPDDVNYDRISVDKIDPYRAITLANEESRRAQDLAGYNLRQNAPTSGSYMANMRALGLQASKQRGAQTAATQYQADVANTQMQNQVNAQNAQIAMQEQIDRLQEKDAARTNVTEGLSGLGSSTANMIRDYRINEVNKTIAKNIGTNNWKYDEDGNLIFRDQDGSVNKIQRDKLMQLLYPTTQAPVAQTGTNNASTNVSPAAAPVANTTPTNAPVVKPATNKVPRQPTLNGKPSTGPKGQAWLKKYGATHNPDGTPKSGSSLTPANSSAATTTPTTTNTTPKGYLSPEGYAAINEFENTMGTYDATGKPIGMGKGDNYAQTADKEKIESFINSTIGKDVWDKLPDQVKTQAYSFMFNTGKYDAALNGLAQAINNAEGKGDLGNQRRAYTKEQAIKTIKNADLSKLDYLNENYVNVLGDQYTSIATETDKYKSGPGLVYAPTLMGRAREIYQIMNYKNKKP